MAPQKLRKSILSLKSWLLTPATLWRLMIANYLKTGLVCPCALVMSNNSAAQTSGTPIKNIVLIHGAWADGSGWKGVYDILVKEVRFDKENFGRL